MSRKDLIASLMLSVIRMSCIILSVRQLLGNFGLSFKLQRFLILLMQPRPTIVARNYGTAAVISYNLKVIAPPVPPVQCWIGKNLISGCEAPTLKRVGGGRMGKMYQ